jgi:hypothetical protein
MNAEYPARVQRIWPLLFSALALWGLVRQLPTLYRAYEFSRDGVTTYGWYTNLDQQDEFAHYAYVAGNTTYSGRVFWNDEDSDLYSRRPGESVEIKYLVHKPWVSLSLRTLPRLGKSAVVNTFCFVMFLGGIGVYFATWRKKNIP